MIKSMRYLIYAFVPLCPLGRKRKKSFLIEYKKMRLSEFLSHIVHDAQQNHKALNMYRVFSPDSPVSLSWMGGTPEGAALARIA
jgi:hypothetical protein